MITEMMSQLNDLHSVDDLELIGAIPSTVK